MEKMNRQLATVRVSLFYHDPVSSATRAQELKKKRTRRTNQNMSLNKVDDMEEYLTIARARDTDSG